MSERFTRDRRRLLACLCGAAMAALGAPVALAPAPRLLWNASASAPVGLWRVAPGAAVERGDMVAARLAEPWRGLAARRHYLPANVPLLKRVAAGPGDRICAAGEAVTINRRVVARREPVDAAGREMPGWRGCILLRDGEYLLLMDVRSSFDGRYFGPTARRDIIGKATPLWLR